MNKMKAAFLAGLVFGLGLVIAQMTNPAKVIGFLNIADQWDPSLLIVMAGGLVTFGVAYRMSKSRKEPYLAPEFIEPRKAAITRPLIIGSLLFGIGWGLGGFCPGPAVVSAAFGEMKAWLFVVAMGAGMFLHSVMFRLMPRNGGESVAND